jgi:integrase
MSRLPTLNWESTRSKWKVVYKGQKYRFDGGTGKSDRDARKRADADWTALKARLDNEAELSKPHRAEYEKVIAEWSGVLTWSVDHANELTAAVARGKLSDLARRLSERVPTPLTWADRFFNGFFNGTAPLDDINKLMEPVYREAGLTPIQLVQGPVPFEQTLWKDRLEAQGRRLKETGCDDTFASNVAKFLNGKRSEVAAGQLSAARADSLRTYLDVVMEFTGRTTSVSRIDQETLSAFRNHLLQRIAAKQVSDYYARDIFAALKLFVRWLASNTDKLAHLPKNIDDRRLSISVGQRKAKTLERVQIQKLLTEANDRTRLYLYLGLNCAMTQQDIADLRQSEVDWSNGVITRKRSKTSDCANVPEVSYRLWKPCFELLQQERSADSERALLNRDGYHLKTEVINASQKLSKTDAVRLSLRRLSEKTTIPFTMKMLKKSAATLLRNNRDYRGLESLFLDHAPSSVADRHYTGVPQELLDEAIAWLGQELGIK